MLFSSIMESKPITSAQIQETTRKSALEMGLDEINIDEAFDNSNKKQKKELKTIIKANLSMLDQLLQKDQVTPINSDVIERLAKVAFAFSDEPNNKYGTRATQILSNTLQNAGPQTTFQIRVRLKQIGTNAALTAVQQIKDSDFIINPNLKNQDIARTAQIRLAQIEDESQQTG
tara:strand:- start:419 stop:940 length:522 start_codon:yes stop_codon:yes gene_type:complete